MRIIRQSWEFDKTFDDFDVQKMLERIEWAGRTAYKSESKITEDSYEKFISNIIKKEHLSVLEHSLITIKITTNRSIANETVRHRLASYTQESTRYCNYSNDITVILPLWFYQLEPIDETILKIDDWSSWKDVKLTETEKQFERWLFVMRQSGYCYFDLLQQGQRPEQARGVLPLDLKTELVMSANLRQWRYILQLRTGKDVHPQCRELFLSILEGFNDKIPLIFNDIFTGTLVLDIMELKEVE